MQISQLRCFLAAVSEGTFTGAAALLGMTQPSVSESIRRLETECGLELFTRGPRRLELTGAGRSLLPWARQAVDGMSGAVDVLAAVRGLQGGVGTFGVLRNASYYFLANLAEEFHRRHPSVRIRLVGQNSAEVTAAVRSGELDAGLVVLPIDDEGLSVRPLARDEVLWVSADPRRVRRPVEVSAIPDRPLILYDAHYGDRDPTRRQVASRAQSSGVRLEPAIEVENVETALDLVARGIGDTFVARAVLERHMRDQLHAAAFREPLYDVIALIRREGSVLSPAAEELSRLAVDLLGHVSAVAQDGDVMAARG